MFRAIVSAVPVLTLLACASPVASERIAASEQAIQAAKAAGAERSPSSAKYLDLARKEMTDGKKLSDSGDRKQAETMLDRAEWDAKLASAVAQESASKTEAQRLAEELKKASENQ